MVIAKSLVTFVNNSSREESTPKEKVLRVDHYLSDCIAVDSDSLIPLLYFNDGASQTDVHALRTPPTKSVIYSVTRNNIHFIYCEMYLHNLHETLLGSDTGFELL